MKVKASLFNQSTMSVLTLFNQLCKRGETYDLFMEDGEYKGSVERIEVVDYCIKIFYYEEGSTIMDGMCELDLQYFHDDKSSITIDTYYGDFNIKATDKETTKPITVRLILPKTVG